MYTWLVEDFNVLGVYPIRFIQRNVADGTFFTWLCLLVITVFLLSKLWKLGILQFGYKLTKWTFKSFVKVCSFTWSVIILGYSLLLLYIQSKKLKFSMSEYWQNRTVNTLGVTFRHVSGADNLTVSHPKHILKALNIFKDVKAKAKDVLYKTICLVRK